VVAEPSRFRDPELALVCVSAQSRVGGTMGFLDLGFLSFVGTLLDLGVGTSTIFAEDLRHSDNFARRLV